MKGFIEVTVNDGDNLRNCIPVSEIKEVDEQPNGKALIILLKTHFKRKTQYNYVYTVETYSEIVDKIAQALS